MEYLKDFDTFIKTVEEKVEVSYKVTNENIAQGLNTYYTAIDDSYMLKTPKLEKDEDEEINPLAKYFPNEEYLSVIDILHSINEETDFLSAFQHYSQSRIKGNHNLLLASILGYGCNLSLSRMGKISKGINENQLENTKTWYFSEENRLFLNKQGKSPIVLRNSLKMVFVLKTNAHISPRSHEINFRDLKVG